MISLVRNAFRFQVRHPHALILKDFRIFDLCLRQFACARTAYLVLGGGETAKWIILQTPARNGLFGVALKERERLIDTDEATLLYNKKFNYTTDPRCTMVPDLGFFITVKL